jgi:hypothetical protein
MRPKSEGLAPAGANIPNAVFEIGALYRTIGRNLSVGEELAKVYFRTKIAGCIPFLPP